MISQFGLVGEARITPAGRAEVLRTTPLFREEWTRNFVIRDLRRLFVPARELRPVGALADGRLVLETPPEPDGTRTRYILSADGRRWEELELLNANRRVYHATVLRTWRVAGRPSEIPAEFEIDAGVYRLNLRIAELTVQPSGGPTP